MSSGIAGRTNYSDWDKKTSSLLSDLETETNQEIQEAKEALGLNGKYASSAAEAQQRQQQAVLKEKKAVLNSYKQREMGVVQVLEDVLSIRSTNTNSNTTNKNSNGEEKEKEQSRTKFVTQKDVQAGKRVLNITNTTGPGHIILTQDLSNLECTIPTNATGKGTVGTGTDNDTGTTLTPKSYPQDAENDVPEEVKRNRVIKGLIKISLTHLKDCTVTLKCKVITGLLEVSHCENVLVKVCQDSTIVTIQADLCHDLNIQFHDAPSGKCLKSPSANATANANAAVIIPTSSNKFMYWGEDKDDRIFHAGVSNLQVEFYRDGFVESQTVFDYKKDGKAEKVGNATAEETQFVTSVLDGELVTEKVLRQGSATGTTVAGGVDGGGGGGGGARAMTKREMKEVAIQKEKIRQAVDKQLGGIKVIDKDGNEVHPIQKGNDTQEDDDVVAEEIYTSMPKSDIDTIVKDCEAQKAKGNEAFVAGEYAQAVLLYTLALDRAAELPDSESKTQLFPRHIVLSNRSASFLKLGHHDKALADGEEAERLDPNYVKGIFRKGLALHAMGRYQDALTSLSTALKIEPKNKQIKQALQFAEVRFQQEMRKRMEG